MLKKGIVFILIIVGIFFTISCNTDNTVTAEAYNPLNEDEIITYIQNRIYNEIGDTVTVNITSKKELELVSASLFDIPLEYEKVDNGHSYTVEIKNMNNTDIIATGTYTDAYVIYDPDFINGKKIKEAYFQSDYREQKGLFLIQSEMVDALEQKFDIYYIYKDVSNDNGYDIFIHSSNYDDINDLLLRFRDIVVTYREEVYTSYSVYIYKDETVFSNTDFESYKNGTEKYVGQSYGKDMIEQYTGKTATRIGFSEGFDHALFTSNGASAAETYDEYVDYKSFDYLVFWYHAEPNSFVGYNNPNLQIFGIK